LKDDIAAMVHIAPTGAVDDRAAFDRNGRLPGMNAGTMEVDGIAAAWIGPGSGHKLLLRIQPGILDRVALIGAAQIVEPCVCQQHMIGVHKHGMASASYLLRIL